jgi:hypothetical protein
MARRRSSTSRHDWAEYSPLDDAVDAGCASRVHKKQQLDFDQVFDEREGRVGSFERYLEAARSLA